MSHLDEQMFFTHLLSSRNFQQKKLNYLEIGSLDINGSVRNVVQREFVSSWIGLDLGPGPGVDIVESGHKYLLGESEIFDVVVSAECMEHNPFWKETFENAIRLLKPGGVLLFTFATDGRKEHGTSRTSPISAPYIAQHYNDYYQNLNDKHLEAIDNLSNLEYAVRFRNFSHHDLYLVGMKGPVNKDDLVELQKIVMDYYHFLYDINTNAAIMYTHNLAKRAVGIMDKCLELIPFGENIKPRLRFREKIKKPLTNFPRISRSLTYRKLRFYRKLEFRVLKDA